MAQPAIGGNFPLVSNCKCLQGDLGKRKLGRDDIRHVYQSLLSINMRQHWKSYQPPRSIISAIQREEVDTRHKDGYIGVTPSIIKMEWPTA